MGILNDIAGTIGGFFDTIDSFWEALTNPEFQDVQASEAAGDIFDDIQPNDEIAAFVVDAIEESILSDIQEAGVTTPDEVEGAVDDAAGVAASWMGGAGTAAAAAEFSSFGQLEAPARFLELILENSGAGGVMGRETEARLQEGIDPALKQLAHREHRSKQANIQDWVEANRDVKWASGQIETREGDVPGEAQSLFSDQDFGWLPDPDTYGTIPDQTELFEFASLESLEPEEIIEEAPQKGVIPDRAAMEQVLHVSGLPEDVKQVYLDVWENLPETAGVIEDSLRLQNVIFELDTLVLDNVMSPREAVAHIRSDVEDFIRVSRADGNPVGPDRSGAQVAATVLDELQRHWDLLYRLPNGSPTKSDIEEWYELGIISLQQFQTLWQAFGDFEPFWPNNAKAVVIAQAEDDIRKANLLGRITTQEATFRLRQKGYTDSQAGEILSGASPDSILTTEAAEQQSVDQLPAEILDGISESDQTILQRVGLGTVGGVADASVSQLTDTGTMPDRTAEKVIAQAQRLIQQAG